MRRALEGPFLWFGGKARVAPVPGRPFGPAVPSVGPFAGGLLILLGGAGEPLTPSEQASHGEFAGPSEPPGDWPQ